MSSLSRLGKGRAIDPQRIKRATSLFDAAGALEVDPRELELELVKANQTITKLEQRIETIEAALKKAGQL